MMTLHWAAARYPPAIRCDGCGGPPGARAAGEWFGWHLGAVFPPDVRRGHPTARYITRCLCPDCRARLDAALLAHRAPDGARPD